MPEIKHIRGVYNRSSIIASDAGIEYVIHWNTGYACVWLDDPTGKTCGECIREDYRVI